MGVPKVRWFGYDYNEAYENSNILIMDLLGNSLEELFKMLRKFLVKNFIVKLQKFTAGDKWLKEPKKSMTM